MQIDGSILIGAQALRRDAIFRAINPATGAVFGPDFCEANTDDVAQACTVAASAFDIFSTLSPTKRADFIDTIADQIMAIGDSLIETAMAESGLPRMRLEGERGRTTGQLRMFANEIRKGRWLDVVIDPALPDRTPPRADLRRMNAALGPVAVFGASNFPLAFSVAGGDTASAFAAGCPVVVKGHPAHPGTGEWIARAIQSAVAECGLPAGVFSYLPGTSHALGGALVADPHIKAVGFTGSRSGGLALMEIARQRREPIPVYAEMSSINPVLLLPNALAVRAQALGAGFAASLTLGAGQFCTNPGIVIALDGPDLDQFSASAREAFAAIAPPTMLSPGIHAAYNDGVAALENNPAAHKIATGQISDEANRCTPALFETSASEFLSDSRLGHEIFGAVSLIIRCADMNEIASVISALEGQLTATVHMDAGDASDAAKLLPLLVSKAGRVLANGWPTGVEVTPAMVHGGPYPATSDGRTTSVGTLSMMRFLRPVCYQDIPDMLLPDALKEGNPWGLPRNVDGVLEQPA